MGRGRTINDAGQVVLHGVVNSPVREQALPLRTPCELRVCVEHLCNGICKCHPAERSATGTYLDDLIGVVNRASDVQDGEFLVGKQ